eukprot:CAMPEP_0181241562 /NCGR_PEP_ID=MMETSP1096-20121128/41196_1 /TAXON_ID=156174 ORGANISM="Chrysochromulina ericina, Strain CCMP281" /NCGR_SAMPLE_ID=MMETSP1096 /ASSEMBLY_ACC=CAM_ASM_000453 /LENGTH=87 /DNA_ID=CAMNT_0023337659 /DNA_START=322 /DNA_END=585 /DNA_ORIENTATION=+
MWAPAAHGVCAHSSQYCIRSPHVLATNLASPHALQAAPAQAAPATAAQHMTRSAPKRRHIGDTCRTHAQSSDDQLTALFGYGQPLGV